MRRQPDWPRPYAQLWQAAERRRRLTNGVLAVAAVLAAAAVLPWLISMLCRGTGGP